MRPTSRWGRYRLISGRIFDADRTAIDNKGWHDQQFRSLSEPPLVSPGLRIFPCRRLIQNLREASGTHDYQERFLAYCRSSSKTDLPHAMVVYGIPENPSIADKNKAR